MNRKAWIGTGVAVVLVGGGAAYFLHTPKEEIKWRTAKVDKGSITARISTTGTVNALIQVPVGTQVSGVVTGLYADFNSLVKKGQVIGKIDETTWLTQIQDAQATLERAQATLLNAQLDYKRNKKLWEQKLLSDSDLDAKDLVLKTAQTSLSSAKAGLSRAKINLDYCTLRAPVDGVVVARLVDVGQTVAASFSTPNMFTIAQDLSRMKVQAAIDEADIGQVRVGQKAFFTVDSYPDKQFRGVVSEVQLNPVINQNVVTYNVMMEVKNLPKDSASAEGAGESGGPRGFHGPRPEGGQGHSRPEGAQGHARPDGTQGQGWPGGARGERAGFRRERPAEAATPANQTATIELNTARYIPQGSPIYKGDLALFPGMTANCTIVTTELDQVMRVPSAALRFNPSAFTKDEKVKAPGAPGGAPGGGQRQGGQGGQRQGGARQGGGSVKGMVARREDHLWILGPDGKPKMLSVKAGATDGMFTEVSGEGITEGLVVLTGVEDMKKAAAPSAAPIGGGGMRR